MPVLDCSVKNCNYNKSYACCLEDINVEGHEANVPNSTACGSFKQDSDQTTSSTNEDMYPQPVVEIDCEAENCTFNEECKCAADHIKIEGNHAEHYTETECSSFSCDRE